MKKSLAEKITQQIETMTAKAVRTVDCRECGSTYYLYSDSDTHVCEAYCEACEYSHEIGKC